MGSHRSHPSASGPHYSRSGLLQAIQRPVRPYHGRRVPQTGRECVASRASRNRSPSQNWRGRIFASSSGYRNRGSHVGRGDGPRLNTKAATPACEQPSGRGDGKFGRSHRNCRQDGHPRKFGARGRPGSLRSQEPGTQPGGARIGYGRGPQPALAAFARSVTFL